MPAVITQYDHPAQFEPLMPSPHQLERLKERARPVVEAALRLQGMLQPTTRLELQDLVRAMNSYYSNLIEGQSTHPLNIDKALKKNFSDKPDIAKRQRIALAHIKAERELSGLPMLKSSVLFKSAILLQAHQAMYQNLSEEDRLSDNGVPVVPGQLRTQRVQIQRHEPPAAAAVPAFLQRADEVYGKDWALESILVAAACAHHRLAWVHPFLDGNGRAVRLHTYVCLHHLTDGLWSVNRGLARQRDAYYQHLSEADMHRHGDLDGRGSLSERMLVQWCEFFIDVCRDQVDFITKMLQPQTLRARLEALIRVRIAERDGYREEVILPLATVLVAGPVSRGDFARMTGLGETTARKAMAVLLQDGLLKSDSHRSEVRIGLPLDGLHILFPDLYPEAAATIGIG